MKITRNMKDEVYCVFLEFINSLDGPGMFFSSAAIIRRLCSYAATLIDINGLRKEWQSWRRWKKFHNQISDTRFQFWLADKCLVSIKQ